ncbi:MAG: hypothetical protein HFJ95_03530 [Muribaculaceae bacterium]|nr:hypothetical protein [Muribaculaceae bacterium]
MHRLFYIYLVLLLTGCSMSSSYSRQLDDAQQMLAKNPQEAYHRLNALDISEFNDSADIARWALLYSEAMVTNNLTAPSDSIINIALSYYSTHNLTEQLQRAEAVKHLLSKSPSVECDKLISVLYIQKEREYQLFEQRLAHQRYIFIGITAILIAAGIIAWLYQRLRIQNLRHEALLAEASDLRSLLSVREADYSGLEDTVAKLFGKRFELIGKLCDTFYEAQGTRTERKAIAEQVKAEIDHLRTDSSTMAEIETSVNECRDNLLIKLKEEMPAISKDDYLLITLLACGFSNRAISMLIGESIDVIYKRKSRLKGKINTASLPNSPLYLSVF